MYDNHQLYHYGVLGMKWGVRRFQNKDGTLTPAGEKRYGDKGRYEYKSQATRRRERKAARAEIKGSAKAEYLRKRAEASQRFDDQQLEYAKRTSVGKALVTKYLMLPLTYRTYAMSRSTGAGRAKSWLRGFFDLNLGVTGWSIQQRRMRENYIKKHIDD